MKILIRLALKYNKQAWKGCKIVEGIKFKIYGNLIFRAGFFRWTNPVHHLCILLSVIYKVLYIHVRLPLQDTLYTYNPAYHHSATFVPVNIEELKRKEKIAHRQKFVSKKDWVYPEVKTLRHCNEHPKKPDLARCDALTHVSVLSILYIHVYVKRTLFIPVPAVAVHACHKSTHVDTFGFTSPVSIISGASGDRRLLLKITEAMKSVY